MSDPAEVTEVGQPERRRLGRYALRYRVADGGMGAVYLAQLRGGEGFEKWVAVKVVHEHVARDANFVRMFLDEARIAARINHPNVAQVFDCGEDAGAHYLAMEYLHGEPLNSVVKAGWRDGSISPALAARIVADAARGLHAAHELKNVDGTPAGVVHRDVSPQNIFVLYDGGIKIVDFGIARASHRTSDPTATDVLKGKLGYMAPEQVNRAPFDRRADVWALGVVLWEASLGRRLFKADGEIATLMAVAHDPVPDPREVAPGYPDALAQIVLRALDRDVATRFATAGDLARELERFLASTGTPMGSDEVADFMRATFAARIAKRDALLTSGDDVAPVERVELHSHSSISRPPRDPGVGFEPTLAATPNARGTISRDRATAPEAVPTRRRTAFGVLAVVLLACVGSVTALVRVLRSETPTHAAVQPTAAPPRVEPVVRTVAAEDAGRAIVPTPPVPVASAPDAGAGPRTIPAVRPTRPAQRHERPHVDGPTPMHDMNGAI